VNGENLKRATGFRRPPGHGNWRSPTSHPPAHAHGPQAGSRFAARQTLSGAAPPNRRSNAAAPGYTRLSQSPGCARIHCNGFDCRQPNRGPEASSTAHKANQTVTLQRTHSDPQELLDSAAKSPLTDANNPRSALHWAQHCGAARLQRRVTYLPMKGLRPRFAELTAPLSPPGSRPANSTDTREAVSSEIDGMGPLRGRAITWLALPRKRTGRRLQRESPEGFARALEYAYSLRLLRRHAKPFSTRWPAG